jgi:DNA-binding NarL/FixJ family response regulator
MEFHCMSDLSAQPVAGVALVVDRLSFRRCALASVLRDWAQDNSMALRQACETDLAEAAKEGLRIAIVNLGGASVVDAQAAEIVRLLRERAPDARIAIVSDRETPEEVIATFRSGAHGFIPTSTEPQVALQALSFVLAGGSFFPPTVLLNRAGSSGARTPARRGANAVAASIFTPSQLRVMAQLREGKSNKMIARQLSLCEATVKLHIRQIMRKLGASNRTQVALYCSMDGILPPDPLHEDRDGPTLDVCDPPEGLLAAQALSSLITKPTVNGHRHEGSGK